MGFIRTSKRTTAKNRRKAANYKRVCAEVNVRDRNCCRVCGVFMEIPAHHHIIFRSQGGEDTTDNLICICADCHDDIHARRIFVTGNGNDTFLTLKRKAA